MRNIILILLLPFTFLSQTQNTEQKVEVPIKAVTLYLDGAEVNQQKQLTINAGITSVVFTNLSSKLIPKSIQVNVGEGVEVLSVTEKLNFLTLQNESQKVKQMRDSLKANQYLTQQLQYDKEAYEKEKEVLAKNNSIGGHEKGVSITELKLAADFYRSRIKEINTEILKLDTKLNAEYLTNARLENQLNELNVNEGRPTGEIIILLQSDQKKSASIDLKYVVSDAGWAPYYELKAEEVGKPITLVYRARAFNNTGINWSDVKIKLSTSDPTRNASKPYISPWLLNFNTRGAARYADERFQNSNSTPPPYQQSQMNNQNLENQISADKLNPNEIKSFNDYKAKNSRTQDSKKVVYEEIQVSELSAEFEIKKSYTIPSDAKPYIVEVTTYSLNATYKHYSIPKIEKSAFLLAQITDWEDLDLIEGPANVYFAGTFVGQSYINPKSVNDTLDLSFGRDSKVLVTRTKIKDFSTEKLLGNTRKITYSYEMVIKNNRKSTINIDVNDQLPISQDSEITVDAVELSKGNVNKDDGMVTWKLQIPPGDSQKIIYTFTIKFPKNRNVRLERTSAKLRAKF